MEREGRWGWWVKETEGRWVDKRTPTYGKDIEQYLVAHWGAEYTHGMEADDALGIKQTSMKEGETCIVSIDKDLLMIPGAHYNFVTKEYIEIGEQEAADNFYKQLLTGDTVDNVPGLSGVGPAKAASILLAPIDDYTEPYHARDLDIYNVYIRHRDMEGKTSKEIYDIIKNRGQLLWIQRNTEREWIPHITWE